MGATNPGGLNELERITLFDGLTPEQLSALDALLHRRTFPAGATLMSIEQLGEAVYIILSGTVKVWVDQENGAEVIISILGAGDVVGEMSPLDSDSRCANVVTIEEAAMLWMDRRDFRTCLRTMPAIAYNLACILAKRLRAANEQIQALATREVEPRVARQLLAFATQYGKPEPNGDIFIPIRLTQSDIASLVGATRESINKIIVSYKEREYIFVDNDRRITIHNWKALANRCGRSPALKPQTAGA
ncbi:MAG TPA: Crp/Fnr family transcriptional regulator, partial [Blastocatellia bacterium]|nr:Crp/Fnr family transcriptional regulator [Blastocatellia bacterium]